MDVLRSSTSHLMVPSTTWLRACHFSLSPRVPSRSFHKPKKKVQGSKKKRRNVKLSRTSSVPFVFEPSSVFVVRRKQETVAVFLDQRGEAHLYYVVYDDNDHEILDS